MYQTLRSNRAEFSYQFLNDKMKNHQLAWPEAIWNEDEYNKYIGSLINKGVDHLEMLQGNKLAQRDWWLYNGFKYRDSKYNAGDALSNFITLRCYEVGNITVTPYSHICPRIKYGSVFAGGERVKRNEPVELVCTQDEMDDTEVYIYSADRLASVGDLSHLKVGLAVFSDATKLQNIIVGSEEPGYTNPNLYSLEVGNNELLTLINVTNCTNKEFTSLDVSGYHGLETILAENTKLTGVMLPNGGHLKTLKLPNTITNLTIQNQKNIETLSLQGQENITTLRIEGTPGLPIESLINNSPKLNRVRLTNIEWNATDESSLRTTIDKLFAAKGLDANGINLEKAVVTGRVHIKEISEDFLEQINDRFPELVVVVNGIAKYFVRYADWDNTLLYRYIATEGTAAIDPIQQGYIEAPSRPDTEKAKYVYKGWSETPTTITRPYSIIAKYEATYKVTFYNNDGSVGYSEWVKEFESAKEPVSAGLMSRPTKDPTEKFTYTFSGWDRDYTVIDVANTEFYPTFNEELRSYWVYFYNDEKKIQESKVFYGDVPIFTGDDTAIKKIIGGEESPYYEFSGWDPDPTQPITGTTYFYAQFTFDGYIEDSWEQIIEACKNGDTSKYGLGGRKRLTYNAPNNEGKIEESIVEMEVVGRNHDELPKVIEGYNQGKKTAALSFIARVVGKNEWQMNSSIPSWGGIPGQENPEGMTGYNLGGWEETKMRRLMQNELFNALPAVLQNNIKPVLKKSDRGTYFPGVINVTTDNVWLPSAAELNTEIIGQVPATGQGTPYPVFNIANSRIKERDGRKVAYWTRSSNTAISNVFCCIDVSGNLSANTGPASMAVPLGFCL